MLDELDAAGVERHEIPVSSDRLIVVYLPPDTSEEVDAVALYTLVATDAGRRASKGWQLASIDPLNLGHAGLFVGRGGSGYETKVAITALLVRTSA
jgi:hypothetical protein